VGKVERDFLDGMLSRAFGREFFSSRPIKDVMQPTSSFRYDLSISEVADTLITDLEHPHVHHYPLVDDDGRFVASFAINGLLLYLKRKVDEQAAELSEKNKQITAGINYASVIQSAVLPKDDLLRQCFHSHFVVWRESQTVGGDFIWAEKVGERALVSVVDCTGHGVPGAFMSLIAQAALSRIVSHVWQDDPGFILEELNRVMRANLSQNRGAGHSDDGLDIGLCHCGKGQGRMEFAGAKISLYRYRCGQVAEIRGCRQSIGYRNSSESFRYRNHSVDVQDGDVFYLASDGMASQLGGSRGYPFGTRRLVRMLGETGSLDMAEQKTRLERELDDYRGMESQTDDVTVLGFTL
jgi:serine phosphatase RsbU (regulator of sigma subunit)